MSAERDNFRSAWSVLRETEQDLEKQINDKELSMPPLGLGMSQWIEGRVLRQEIRQLTGEKYSYILRQFAEFVGSTRPIDEITVQDIEAWLGSIRGRNGGQAKPATIRTKKIPLKEFFGWAEARGIIEVNPTDGLQKTRRSEVVPRRLPHEVCVQLLHVADFRQTTAILLGLHLGLRACEVSRMNIEDWNRGKRELYINGKGGRDRVLPVEGEIEAALGLWTRHIGEQRGPMFPSERNRHTSAMPLDKRGNRAGRPHRETVSRNRISAQWAGRLTTDAAKLAGVAASSHRLRHTCASDMVERGVPLPVVQRILGHQSVATTSVYVVAAEDDTRKHIVGRNYKSGLTSDLESVTMTPPISESRETKSGGLATAIYG